MSKKSALIFKPVELHIPMDEPSGWTVVIRGSDVAEEVTVDLYFGDKETPTHTGQIPKSYLKTFTGHLHDE